MLGTLVGFRCLRRERVVTTAGRANISTTLAVRSIGRSVLYDLTSNKEKPDKTDHGNKTSEGSNSNHSGVLVAAKDVKTGTMTNPLGFVKLNRKTSTQRAKAPVQSLTSKMVEAKGNPHQTKTETERLTEKLKDDTLEAWQRRKIELRLKLKGEGWNPAKKLATSSMEKIRLLNAEFPEVWTMKRLSGQFKVSQEAIRRILKSKFQPSESHTQKREKKRSMQIREYKNSRLDRVQKTK